MDKRSVTILFITLPILLILLIGIFVVFKKFIFRADLVPAPAKTWDSAQELSEFTLSNMVSDNGTLKLAKQNPSSQDLIFRPIGNFQIGLASSNGMANYLNVNEENVDYNNYVYRPSSQGTYSEDRYNTAISLPTDAVINSISVHYWSQNISSAAGKALINLNGTSYYGAEYSREGAWVEHSDSWSTNPAKVAPNNIWTISDLANIKIGFAGKGSGRSNKQWHAEMAQIYLTVNYTSSNYASLGTALKQSYDSGRDNAAWTTLSWSVADLPRGTDIYGRLRAANTLYDLGNAEWSNVVIGKGGPLQLSNKSRPSGRYAQIEISLATTDPSKTPILDLITINGPIKLQISGAIFGSDERTKIIGTSRSIGLRIDGGAEILATSNPMDGSFSFPDQPMIPGSVITIYFFNGSEKGNFVTISDSASDLTGITLYADHLVVASNYNDRPISNSDLAAFDSTKDSTNMVYSVDTAKNSLSVPAAELLVLANTEFRPGGDVDIRDIDLNGTYSPENYTTSLSGNWDGAAGALNAGTSTVVLTDFSIAKNILSNNQAFYNLKLAQTGGILDKAALLSDPLSVSNDLTIENGTLSSGGNAVSLQNFNQFGGTFNAPSTILSLSGNFNKTAGTFNHSGRLLCEWQVVIPVLIGWQNCQMRIRGQSLSLRMARLCFLMT